MLFNVPQFIDIEDKIVGPLTAKQLGWLALGGVILLVCFNYLDNQAFILSVIIVGIIVGALAFYRPYNQSLIQFIFSGFSFLTRPKMYIWKRFCDNMNIEKKHPSAKTQKKIVKRISRNKIEEVANMLDTK